MSNARRISSMSRTTTQPPDCGVYSHLCGSNATESARSMPANRGRRSSASIAGPPYAASTWNQRSSSRQTSAISSSGSTTPVETVPAFATTAIGWMPAAPSSAIAARSSSTRIR